MAPFQLFSGGLEFAPFVTSSCVLRKSWDVIVSSNNHDAIVSTVGEGLSWKVYKEQDSDLIIVAFEAKLDASKLQADLVPSSDLKQKNFLLFEFLCTPKLPLFSVNSTAVSFFYDNLEKLDQLKSELWVNMDKIKMAQKTSGTSYFSEVAGSQYFNAAMHHGSIRKQSLYINIGVRLRTSDPQYLHEMGITHWVDSSNQLIITGHGLGGPIASLFTLSLLDSIGLGKKRPLCITFGSPLVGDKNLQEAISRSSTWSSCFLHVVACKDPLPKALTPHTNAYMPFGMFLLCSNTDSTCFENPESVLELLAVSFLVQDQGFKFRDYGNIVETLYRRSVYKDITLRAEDFAHSSTLRASIILQLAAIGLTPNMQQQQQQKFDFNALVTKIERHEIKFNFLKTQRFDPSRKLNSVKKDMAQLEWYKKNSKNQSMGYYDRFKRMSFSADHDMVQFQKRLTHYWAKMVEEAEMKPQKESASFRTRWLYAGTNYRRMVEPLDIAEHYVFRGGKDYVNKARSKHYKQLEEWLKEGKTEKKDSSNNTTRKNNVEAILTSDSCFWAHVEEALLSCKQLKEGKSDKEKEEAAEKLFKFEDYVYGLLKNYEVSPEIFLEKSSYMILWKQYKAIIGTTHNAALASFMSNPYYYKVQYTSAIYDFH